MAFTEGFEYDIFISYAHPDNSAPKEKKGWVDDFHEELEAYLVRRFDYNKIAIWRDKNLDGNTRFDNRIQGKGILACPLSFLLFPLFSSMVKNLPLATMVLTIRSEK